MRSFILVDVLFSISLGNLVFAEETDKLGFENSVLSSDKKSPDLITMNEVVNQTFTDMKDRSYFTNIQYIRILL